MSPAINFSSQGQRSRSNVKNDHFSIFFRWVYIIVRQWCQK